MSEERIAEIEKQMKELWPDTCPECSLPAWIGPVNVSCVGSTCRHEDKEERAKYSELLGEQLTLLSNRVDALMEIDASMEIDEEATTDPILWVFRPQSGAIPDLDVDD